MECACALKLDICGIRHTLEVRYVARCGALLVGGIFWGNGMGFIAASGMVFRCWVLCVVCYNFTKKQKNGRTVEQRLSAAEEYTLKLIAAQSAGISAPAIPTELWPAVCGELETQAIIGYPVDVVDSLELSANEQGKYLARVGRNLSSWYGLMMAQDRVLRVFREEGIPVAVLKGAAAAVNYPQPNSRCMGDIDIIVPPDSFERAFSCMESLGWENNTDLRVNPRHAGFAKTGCPELELHRFFSTCVDKRQAQALDQAIYNAIPRAQWCDVDGFLVPVLPALENGLVLLAHVNQHLGSGLGLRQILDWQMFVRAYADDAFWCDGFQQAAQSIGMEKLAVTVTALCQRYLGLQEAGVRVDEEASVFQGGGLREEDSLGLEPAVAGVTSVVAGVVAGAKASAAVSATAPAVAAMVAPAAADSRSSSGQGQLTWCDDADAQLVDDLLLYIMRKGNMGRKVEHGAQATRTVLHNFRNPAALVRYLYEGGRSHWETARKHVWLAPAACVYQVGHIVRKGMARGVGVTSLANDARDAQAEVDLLSRLEVTRM